MIRHTKSCACGLCLNGKWKNNYTRIALWNVLTKNSFNCRSPIWWEAKKKKIHIAASKSVDVQMRNRNRSYTSHRCLFSLWWGHYYLNKDRLNLRPSLFISLLLLSPGVQEQLINCARRSDDWDATISWLPSWTRLLRRLNRDKATGPCVVARQFPAQESAVWKLMTAPLLLPSSNLLPHLARAQLSPLACLLSVT